MPWLTALIPVSKTQWKLQRSQVFVESKRWVLRQDPTSGNPRVENGTLFCLATLMGKSTISLFDRLIPNLIPSSQTILYNKIVHIYERKVPMS